MPDATESTVLSNEDRTLAPHDGTDGILEETATSARAGRLAACLAGSDLDAESLEMITAALTVEVCDDVNAATA
jgi:hypothetical protein